MHLEGRVHAPPPYLRHPRPRRRSQRRRGPTATRPRLPRHHHALPRSHRQRAPRLPPSPPRPPGPPTPRHHPKLTPQGRRRTGQTELQVSHDGLDTKAGNGGFARTPPYGGPRSGPPGASSARLSPPFAPTPASSGSIGRHRVHLMYLPYLWLKKCLSPSPTTWMAPTPTRRSCSHSRREL